MTEQKTVATKIDSHDGPTGWHCFDFSENSFDQWKQALRWLYNRFGEETEGTRWRAVTLVRRVYIRSENDAFVFDAEWV